MTRGAKQLAAALAADDRPIVGVVGMDAAGETGTCGLCVVSVEGRTRDWYAGPPVDARTFDWLGKRVAKLCPPGTRVIMFAESDAFGNGNGRKLGIGVGAVQGLLLDLNAIAPLSRVDLASRTWRAHAGITVVGRAECKAAAVKKAYPYVGATIPADGAEAVLIAECGRSLIRKALRRGAAA